MSIIFKEEPQDVLDSIIDLTSNCGCSIISASLNSHYKTISYKFASPNGSEHLITNNSLNAKKYYRSKEEKGLIAQFINNDKNYEYETIYNQFKDSLPLNYSAEVDTEFRKYAILPGAQFKYNDKENIYENIEMYDINKCYTAALSGHKIPYPDLTSRTLYTNVNKAIERLRKDQGVLLMHFTVEDCYEEDPSLFPISQPGHKDDEGNYDLQNSGAFIRTEYNNAIQDIYLVSYHIDDEIFNEWEYFNTKYSYNKIKFNEIIHYSFLPEYSVFPSSFASELDKMYFALQSIEDPVAKLEIKYFSAMIVGKLFQKIDVETVETRYRYELEDKTELTKFRLSISESKRDKRNRKNNVTVVPVMYAIINKYVRESFSSVSYKDIIKITADSITVPQETPGVELLPIGYKVGQMKIKKADYIELINNRQYVMYNNDGNIVTCAIGGLPQRIRPYLKTKSDWDVRFSLKDKYGFKSFEDLFTLKVYNEEISHIENQHYYDYPNLSENKSISNYVLLAPQGTGKTTSIVKSLKQTNNSVLHLFYNKKPQEENAKQHDATDDQIYKVRTLDSLIQEIYRFNSSNTKNQKWEVIRKYILNNIDKLDTYLDLYDIIVIDEIQSIYGTLTDIVKHIIRKYSHKLICAGDFNQQFDKIHRGNNPFTIDLLPNSPRYTLNINYRNAIEIQNYAKQYMDFNTEIGSNVQGEVETINFDSKTEFVSYLNSLNPNYHFIHRTEYGRYKLKKLGVIPKIYSVSQSLSLSPDVVVLINSTKTSINENDQEAYKEILCSILRAKYSLKIVNLL